MRKTIVLIILLIIIALPVFSDDTGAKVGPIALPDISLIGNIIGDWNQDTNRVTFGMDELEMVIAGYIYPQIKADAVLSIQQRRR